MDSSQLCLLVHALCLCIISTSTSLSLGILLIYRWKGTVQLDSKDGQLSVMSLGTCFVLVYNIN